MTQEVAINVVTEFIKGLVQTYPGLQYLDGFPEVKVVLRANLSGAIYDKVAIISGGGSGHEPAHAGFVGEGMLTAAICGDVFVSPPVDSILAGIRAVTGPPGCLLIVKNYPQDRLNFMRAAELATDEGYKVEVVIVGDDCAQQPPRGISGRRGSAGTILVHKIAGAAAASGLYLEEVVAEAKRASDMVWTMGVAFSLCTVPGQLNPDYILPSKFELGIGIHGEPGLIRPLSSRLGSKLVSDILKEILSTENVTITSDSKVVLVINGHAVRELRLKYGHAVERVYTGSFLTSLDMEGFSITVMSADQAILKWLDAPTRAPNWPVAVYGNPPLELRELV
ncbi:hypothetical protein OROMI_018478 [Orobanche minor]